MVRNGNLERVIGSCARGATAIAIGVAHGSDDRLTTDFVLASASVFSPLAGGVLGYCIERYAQAVDRRTLRVDRSGEGVSSGVESAFDQMLDTGAAWCFGAAVGYSMVVLESAAFFVALRYW